MFQPWAVERRATASDASVAICLVGAAHAFAYYRATIRDPLRVYLDDLRPTPSGFVRCAWPDEAIALLKTGLVRELSLDHDLGDADLAFHECRPEITGNDVLAWIEEQVVTHGFTPPPVIRVHSDNAAAAARMRSGIENLARLRERFARSPLTYATRSHAHAGDDRCAVIAHDHGLLIVVSDGAGGMPGGREAAALVVNATLRDAGALTTHEAIAAHLTGLDAACEADPRAGEATCVMLFLTEHGAIEGASVGDSEAWLIEDRRVARLTQDQRKKRLGSGRAQPVAFTATLSPGAALVVGSDGLFNYAAREAIVAAAQGDDVERCAEALLQAAIDPPIALADDLTAVVVSRGAP